MDVPPPTPKQAQSFHSNKEFLELVARQRLLDERYSGLNNKIEIIEQNMISKNKKISGDIKELKIDLSKFKKEIDVLNDSVLKIINEIKLLARKEDVDILKKYLEYWKPANFVNREILESEIEKIRKEFMKNKSVDV
jgi:predicted  nucleic acid-binding Zn-ribbon protein